MKKVNLTKEEYLEAKNEIEKDLIKNKEKANQMTYEEQFDAFVKFAKLYNVKKVGEDK